MNLRAFFFLVTAVLFCVPSFAAPAKTETASSTLTSMPKSKAEAKVPAKRPRVPAFKPDMSKAKEVEKVVKGFIVFVRKDMLSVEFAQSEGMGGEEMLIRVTPEMKLKGVKKASELQRDDQVEVRFKQVILPAETKEEAPRVLDTKAVLVTRLKTGEAVHAERAAAALTAVPPADPAPKREVSQ
jgi:hypothetical protein